ncbi:MAG: acetate/propionate family kinase [Candidatus Dormibacteraeota bacterium]|nr:acetate/propionate family kinase [Candidatus Dormibacteraeota bacterium]
MIPTRILVCNGGSSSLKLSVLGQDDALLADREVPAQEADRSQEELARELATMGPAEVVGHRVVQGGSKFTKAVVIDDGVLAGLAELVSLDPLHMPQALRGIGAARMAFPEAVQVACFDTAFHARMPEAARTYALPAAWRRRWGLRRHGFHGLSHSYSWRTASRILGSEDLRMVTCHLGSGSSLAAIRHGRSVDTTMGFTPLEGIPMATRSGSVDPGLLLWLEQEKGISADELSDALENRSGMLGLARTKDMREVVERAAEGDPAASLAQGVFLHHLVQGIASMTASLGGLDALVFTGGIGENSEAIRRLAVGRLGFLGLAIDERRNQEPPDGARIELEGRSSPILMVRAREDLEVATQARRLLAG